MASLARIPQLARITAALDAFAGTYAQVVFSRRALVGVMVLAACATEPRCLLLSACALLGATLSVRALGVANAYVPYGYNALLCGVALGHEFACTPMSIGFAIALGGCSVLATAALTALAGYAGYLPVVSLPFILTSWFALGAAPHLSLLGAPPTLDTWAAALPTLPALALQSLGMFVLLPNVVAGAFVLCALALHSRISAVLASLATLSVLGLLTLADAPLSGSVLQIIGCSAALSCVAIGGVWLVPSRESSLLALCTALLAAFFALGFAGPLSRLGLPQSLLPFNVAVILMLCALRQRASNRLPRLVDLAADSPEQQLLNHAAQPLRTLTEVALHLPFNGSWTCTQGVDGAYTHRGTLRHAFDFEMYSPSDGALCAGEGLRPEDYYCFAQPVLAVADGTVVGIENTIPNNAVGDTNSQTPWGNYVCIQHANSACSVVAHLVPGSVTVHPGQYVSCGTVLGYCGNSGYSPRPHLHFQLQSTPLLGSLTLPCRFSDVVVRAGSQLRFEQEHVPQEGETLRALEPEYALGAYFELPRGATLTYRVADQLERVSSEIDPWGRCVLRSLDRRTELAYSRDEKRFRCEELRGAPGSVLTLLHLALPQVPFERDSNLSFRSRLPARWLGGPLRALCWDLAAPFVGARGLELHARLHIEYNCITVVGRSQEHTKDGTPRLQTRAVLGRGVGPMLIEVSVGEYVRRAELVLNADAPQRVVSEASGLAASPLAVGLGDWS